MSANPENAPAKKHDEERQLTINNPTDNPQCPLPAVDVVAMGMATFGKLCICNGATNPAAGSNFVGLYFRVGRGANQDYTAEEVVTGAEHSIAGTTLYPMGPTGMPAEWHCNGQLSADCSRVGTGDPPVKNTLHVVEKTMTGNPPVTSLSLVKAVFCGQGVRNCQ